ncbi:putative RIO kinase 2 [Spironucleus salmonicida]|uniref:non-specific serine/threonine protein kinase n=1 Tax=Spironucleus salmonicida TaxID=348837 RepID=V6LIC0_9EUKA|nr:putative RIO kinase 2 [Spironucleus salmonicida]|eukprot:EST44287.1 RIO kinase 2, putative [Spironucleus salmonicida]
MPNIDLSNITSIQPTHLRLLQSIEQAMKNHDFAPLTLINQISNIQNIHNTLSDLCKCGLIAHVGGTADGYQLTFLGFDYLAISVLRNRKIIDLPLRKIGVGKEAEVWICSDFENRKVALKLHKLGLNSFKNARTLRNYSDKNIQWWKMSQLAAVREFGFGKALFQRGMDVVQMLDQCRHCVVMELCSGVQMSRLRGLNVDQARYLGARVYKMMIQMMGFSVIHGDCNEYNVIVEVEGEDFEFEEIECEEGLENYQSDSIANKIAHQHNAQLDSQQFQSDLQNQSTLPIDSYEDIIQSYENTKINIFKSIKLIDFPQLIQLTDDDAEYQFNRDVESFEGFLNRRFKTELSFPRFADIQKCEIINSFQTSEKFARLVKMQILDEEVKNEVEESQNQIAGSKMLLKVRKVDLKTAAKQQMQRVNQKRNQSKRMEKGQNKSNRDRYGGDGEY